MQHSDQPESWTLTERRGGRVQPLEGGGWMLSIPPGPPGEYRWAQIDDYRPLPRGRYLWLPPVWMEVEARASADQLPGTWGFGLWNNPFAMSLLVSGADRKLPALPNAAWFFFASPPNYLSLRDDQPAQGFLAAVFRSPRLPGLLLAPAALAAPLLAVRPLARLVRRLGRSIVRDVSTLTPARPTDWHAYGLAWERDGVRFFLDGRLFFETPFSPNGPLGFVLWIDNQYAAFTPRGELGFGKLATTEEQRLEVRSITLRRELPESLLSGPSRR